MKRILVADDSVFMRSVMRNILTKNGHIVIGEAENGKIAFELYKELRPDMVTLDITMDEMNGLEALKHIIDFDRNAIIMMVSAMGQRSFVQEAITLGAKGFLVKPFEEHAIIATINKLSLASSR